MDAPPPYSPRDELSSTFLSSAHHRFPETYFDINEQQIPVDNQRTGRLFRFKNVTATNSTIRNSPEWFKCNRKLTILGIWAIIISLSIAGAATVVTIGRKRDVCAGASLTPYNVGGSVCEAYYSHRGVWNGSDIATLPCDDESSSLWVFAQDYNGDILRLRKSENGALSLNEVVATDARNSTRLAVIEYQSSQHVFYFDQNNCVGQMILYGDHWLPGPFSSSCTSASDSEDATLQVCFWKYITDDGTYYNTTANGTSISSLMGTGLQLWYAVSNTELRQYTYAANAAKWYFDRSWTNVSGQAGLACQSWPGSENTTSYIIFVDWSNTVATYWKDISTKLTSTSGHPINEWTRAPNIDVPDAFPSTPIYITNEYLMFQNLADPFGILGYNITWAAEYTTIKPQLRSDREIYNLRNENPNTRWTVTPSLYSWQAADDFLVFYQGYGDDISEVEASFSSWGPTSRVYPPE